MKKNVVMLTITIHGIDSEERSKIFRLVSKVAVVGSQVTYKTGDTIECSLPASNTQEIPDGFFDLVSTHEGSTLKVENVCVETEETDQVERNSDDLSGEDFKEANNNEDKRKKEEDNVNISENSDNISETSTVQESQAETKQKRGKAVLTDDFCDKEIENVFVMLKSKQQTLDPANIEDSVLLLNKLIDSLAQLLNITDSQKKETFAKLMNLAVKCERGNPKKPVTTRAMKKEKSDISSEEWTKVNNWLGERVRRHGLTLSTFFEYVFRCVHKYEIHLTMEENPKTVAEPVMMPILLDDKKAEFQNQFEKIMNSEELSEDEKVRSILEIFGITSSKAIRLAWQAIQHESPINLDVVAKEALISKEEFTDVVDEISLDLEKSGLLSEITTVESFLTHLKIMIDL